MTDLLTFTTTDDLTPLGSLDGVDYHELRLVVLRDPSGALTPVCTLQAWPDTLVARLIQARTVIDFQQQQIENLARMADEGADARDALARLAPVAAATSGECLALRLKLAEAERRIAELSARPAEVSAAAAARYSKPPWVCTTCGEVKGKDAYYTKMRGGRIYRQRTICRACMTQKDQQRPLDARVDGELTCPECEAAGVLPGKPLFTQQNLAQHRRFAHGVVGKHAKAPAQIAPAEDAAPGWQCKQCGTDGLPDRHYDEFCVDCASTPTELAA